MDVKKTWPHLYAAYKILRPEDTNRLEVKGLKSGSSGYQKRARVATYQAKSILSEKLLQEAKKGIFIDKRLDSLRGYNSEHTKHQTTDLKDQKETLTESKGETDSSIVIGGDIYIPL